MCDKYLKLCPSYREYNVFGVPDKGCCYNQMKYCCDVPCCVFKRIVNSIKNDDFNFLKDLFEV